MELLNQSLNMTHDLTNNVAKKMNLLRNVCQQLFEKLRCTANFLSVILDKLEQNNEEDLEIIKLISDIRLELDKSMQETNYISNEIDSKFFVLIF